MAVIVFQGEHGSFSEQACHQQFGVGVHTVSCRTFEELFSTLDNDRATAGVVPVENSAAGSINKASDLLFNHDLRIQGEIILRVEHNLLAIPGHGDKIKKVRSHTQALSQCEGFLNRNSFEAVPWYNTAGSAKDLAECPEPNVGVIASSLAAEIYGLEIVRRNIEDASFNYTRFVVIGKGEAGQTDNAKTSIVFVTPHNPDGLSACIREFADRKIKLLRLVSRPRRDYPWQYVFYMDVEGHWREPECGAALLGLLNNAAFVKMLGSYPAAVQSVADRYVRKTVLQEQVQGIQADTTIELPGIGS
ncbi:MAG: prephenate dehydratase [Caldilineaceae bacterium SB0675_bin_29]|uniref:prephenate dehydratase n=1 Tax=Caldilineaceae bacterium SB0675_bin_29 TaxID=2605266 RepID=A0A6B1G0S0_9CHLR|nr:prephenate dehydratase [Caldilineaceae bacterium SB0675_bin_29]